MPDNLIYSFDDAVSVSGWFQRLDNFLDKGLEQSFQTYKGNVELATVWMPVKRLRLSLWQSLRRGCVEDKAKTILPFQCCSRIFLTNQGNGT